MALLTACGGTGPQTRAEAPAVATGPAGSMETEPPDGSADATMADPTASASRAAPSVGDLPLKEGVYARVETASDAPSCPPANAAAATFDGEGFGGRNSTGCRFEPRKKAGATWSGTQTCTDTYSKETRTEDLAITIDGPTRYTQRNRFGTARFALCPGEDLADWGG